MTTEAKILKLAPTLSKAWGIEMWHIMKVLVCKTPAQIDELYSEYLMYVVSDVLMNNKEELL